MLVEAGADKPLGFWARSRSTEGIGIVWHSGFVIRETTSWIRGSTSRTYGPLSQVLTFPRQRAAEHGLTAVHAAVERGHLEVVQFLIKARVDVDHAGHLERDMKGCTHHICVQNPILVVAAYDLTMPDVPLPGEG